MKTIVVGAGFGGLNVAKSLAGSPVEVTLIDKNNHHLFQPLLYQVAVSALSPGDIAYPIRTIFRKTDNIQVVMGEVVKVDLKSRRVVLFEGEILDYDYLVLAPGSNSSFYGNEDWQKFAIPLKTLEDALEMREKILLSFEFAQRRKMQNKSFKEFLTFVIVGGGPTGVELSGAISELIYKTILPDFPMLKREKIEVILIDAGNKLISNYEDDLSEYAYSSLSKLGVKIYLGTRVKNISKGMVETDKGVIYCCNVFWAAGNVAPDFLKTLGVRLDNMGRVIVNSDLSIPGFPDAFVIGDAACFKSEDGKILPGIAPVAIQQGEYVAKIIRDNIPFGLRPSFVFRDKGMMVTIGKARAVAVLKENKFKGLFAWLLWSIVHVMFLIGFRNKLRVMIEWIWYYFTNKSGARLIVNKHKSNNYNIS